MKERWEKRDIVFLFNDLRKIDEKRQIKKIDLFVEINLLSLKIRFGE